MSQHPIREVDAKRILSTLPRYYADEAAAHTFGTPSCVGVDGFNIGALPDSVATHPWLAGALVAKPDCLIKRRGKAGLLLLNADLEGVGKWLDARLNSVCTADGVRGVLTNFIVEPFLHHTGEDEHYISIQSVREGDNIMFYHQGGVDVGDVDAKASQLLVPIGQQPTVEQVNELIRAVSAERAAVLNPFIRALFALYADLHFALLEINPIVVVGGKVYALDVASKVDETAAFLVGNKWGHLSFPPPFGRAALPEEAFIHELDGQTGASLKLTILNPNGRVWTMVAGGGASVVYADTISDLGFGGELANYGEYSGAPTEEQTFQYARTILSLMTTARHESGKDKILIIGGGIANFTDVAETFNGIIRALRMFRKELRATGVQIWVRRAGPNYQEGLRRMRKIGAEIEVPVHVYGPETHMTAIVPMALGMPADPELMGAHDINGPIDTTHDPTRDRAGSNAGAGAAAGGQSPSLTAAPPAAAAAAPPAIPGAPSLPPPDYERFSNATRAIVYGMQLRAVQGMLDFDSISKRTSASVAAIIFPFSGNHFEKFYFRDGEILIPVYQSIGAALAKHRDVDVLINFASFRSAYEVAMEGLEFPSIRTIAIIAEGIPERQTRTLIAAAARKNVLLIGPATVGGIKPGCFRIGNTGGMLDNVVASKLYRPGSVAYVSKSGGMSNELNNILMRNSDGTVEGVAIGGDRYPGSRFIDHILRYQANPAVKMIVLLGEVGGVDEYDVCAALKDGRITKPLVAWCIGTCAKMFPYEVQFGHAGALANSVAQTADAKNRALREAGAIVPANFNDLAKCIRATFRELVQKGVVVVAAEPDVPTVPMDFAWAQRLGLIRKPSSFVSSISDDRGDELLYAGIPISKLFEENVGVGGVISLLWFRRRLPDYATKFIEMVLVITADHGPAVSGAHNTIVTARAGKDLISSLCSGLLTVGPRFGGALDDAAAQFSSAFDSGASPADFVSTMRRENKLIMGIGHRIKSLANPDKRVVLLKTFAKEHFPRTDVLEYAEAVELLTTKKKDNLILNVDGCIAVCFVDLLRNCGAFTREEADEHIANGCLNGLFVMGRSIGFIGHYLDQKRLKQGLYRHPWDDISYIGGPDM